MRVEPKFGPIQTIEHGMRRIPGPSFSLAGQAQAAPAMRTGAAAQSIGGIEALLVLQGASVDPALRGRKAIRRGKAMLDALDGLKVALLAGQASMADLRAIREALAQNAESTGDAELDSLLSQIELRAEVEIAKLDRQG